MKSRVTFYWPLQEMERSTDVLAAGLLDVSDPGLSNKYFLRQVNLRKFYANLFHKFFFFHG